MIKAAVMGYGTIGSGVAKILDKNGSVIADQAGQEAELKYVLDLREFRDSPMTDKIAHDFRVIQQDEEVKIIVEAMGGLNSAYPFVRACLMVGKHVVTSNKALVAVHGAELLVIARRKNVNSFFKASAGGDISIIHPLYRCLVGKRIEEITDILNGITSFILTKMDEEGESFRSALKETQNLGYAERNPEVDVESYDTCRKIAILTTIVAGREMDYEDIRTGGITWTMDINLKCAEKMGTSVKLFGTSYIKDDRVLVYVAPVIVNKTSSLYSVNDVLNDVLAKGSMLGASMFYGNGAGKFPTGSVVVADITEAAQNLRRDVSMGWTGEKQATEPMDQVQFRYFVRTAGSYRSEEQDVKSAFDQVEVIELCGMDEFIFLTAQMTGGESKKGAISCDTKEWERSEHGIKQTICAMLQHMASVISRTIGVITRQGFPCLFHLLTGLYCPGCGGIRAFRALLVGNLPLSIRYHPLVAYMAMVLTTELVSFGVSGAAKDLRYYLRREKFLVYIGVVIALVNWVYKNYILVVGGVGLPPFWPR